MKPSVAKHFGIVPNQDLYRGSAYKMFINDLRELIHSNEMIALTGEVGAGKTTLFHDLTRENNRELTVVRVRSLDKERLKIGGIVDAMIYDLSMESPRKFYEARSRQLQRIVGDVVVNQKRKVCVVIENAHRLHGNTILALKELREMSFAGFTKMFSIVLVGWTSMLSKIERMREIYLRMEFIQMNERNGWMTFEDRKEFLAHVYGNSLSETVRAQVAISARLPLELCSLVERKFTSAYYEGKRQLDVSDFDVPLKQMKEVIGVSDEDIAQLTGMNKSSVNRCINGKDGYATSVKKEIIRKAIEKLAMRKEAV